VSVTVETVDEEEDDDDSLAAASVSINAVDVVQNCENDTSISLDIPCESGVLKYCMGYTRKNRRINPVSLQRLLRMSRQLRQLRMRD
jgi:hypothetical protein